MMMDGAIIEEKQSKRKLLSEEIPTLVYTAINNDYVTDKSIGK